MPVPPVSTPVEAHHAYVVSVLQEAGALFFPVQRKEAKKGWIQASTWQIMPLAQAWRKVRSAERAWWQQIQLCILWQGWRSWLVVYMDRAVISSEIPGLVTLMRRRLAIIERIIDTTFDHKTKLVRYDRRQASIAILVAAAQRAEVGDDKGLYDKLSQLRPGKLVPSLWLGNMMARLPARKMKLPPDWLSMSPQKWADSHHRLKN